MIALFATLVLAGPIPEDVIVLKDGRIVAGRPMARTDDGVEILYENGDVRVPRELVEHCLIDGDDPLAGSPPDPKGKGRVQYDGKWVSPSRRNELVAKRVAERRAELAEIAAHSAWVDRLTEETKYFAFEHTLPPRVFAEYRELMEGYFAFFLKDWKIKIPRDLGPLKVCLYRNYEDYKRISDAPEHVVGWFRFVDPLELNFYYDKLDEEGTLGVMYHESNHYLQKLIDVDFHYPHFPGESLAEYYGASHWDPDKRKLTTGLVQEGRLVEIQMDILQGETMSLERLLQTEKMYEHYNWGWSLVHFLMSDKKLSSKFRKFVLALPSAKDVPRERGNFNLSTVRASDVYAAFRKYMGLKSDEDFRELEARWHEYVEQNLELVSARGKEKAARRAEAAGLRIKATRLYSEAIDDGSLNPTVYHRCAWLLSEDPEHFRRALELWDRASALDPLQADFYAYKGDLMRRHGRANAQGEERDALVAEGERLMRLALELDPNQRLAKSRLSKKGD